MIDVYSMVACFFLVTVGTMTVAIYSRRLCSHLSLEVFVGPSYLLSQRTNQATKFDETSPFPHAPSVTGLVTAIVNGSL